jgi:hypothetical protein
VNHSAHLNMVVQEEEGGGDGFSSIRPMLCRGGLLVTDCLKPSLGGYICQLLTVHCYRRHQIQRFSNVSFQAHLRSTPAVDGLIGAFSFWKRPKALQSMGSSYIAASSQLIIKMNN